MSTQVKISQFPVTNSIASIDLVPIIKTTGNNAYKNYVVAGSNLLVPSSSHAGYADAVQYNNVLNKPTLISSSAQFGSSDNPLFGNVTASNFSASNTIQATSFSGSNLTVSHSEVSGHSFVSGTFHGSGNARFDNNLTVTNSIFSSYITANSGSTFSGSNSLGNNTNQTQSIYGLTSIHGNVILSSSYGIVADSASFKAVAPLVSASVSNLSSTTISASNLTSTNISASVISSSNISTTSQSVSYLVAGTVTVTGNLNATASNAQIAQYAVTSSYSLSNSATASLAYTSSLSIQSLSATSASYASSSQTSVSSSFATTSSVATSLINNYSYVATASNTTGNLTASYALVAATASYTAVTQVFSNSSSYVVTASNALTNATASYANTASLAQNAVSSAYAANVVALGLNYVVTASNTTGNLTASYAATASSIDKSVSIGINSASIGTANIAYANVTNLTVATASGTLLGTSSYAVNALTASYVLNASAATSSYSLTSGYAISSSLSTSSSYAVSASSALISLSSSTSSLAVSASYANNSTTADSSSNAVSASRYVYAQSVRRTVVATHSFLPGNILTLNGSTLAYAQANTLSGSNTFGMVESGDYVSGSATSGSTFSLVTFGKVSLPPTTALTTGATYYLSDIIPGGYASNPPSNPSSYNQPVFLATNTSEAFVYKVSPTLQYGATASYAFTSSYNLDPTLRETYSVSNASTLYSVGQAIYITSSGNVALANASTEPSSRTIGVIVALTSNTLTVAYSGRFKGNLITCNPGDIIYLSDVNPGGYTTNKFSLASGSVIKPIATAISNAEVILLNQYATNEFVGNSAYAQTASYAFAASTLIGSLPTNGNSIRDTYSSSNSFVAGNVIGFDYYTNQPTLCIANSVHNSNALGIVESANSSSFTVVYSGKIFLPAGYFSSYGPIGSLFYLSPTVSGSIQLNPPTGSTQVVKSVIYSVDNSTGIVAINSSLPTTASFAQSSSVALFSNLAFNSLGANSALSANSSLTSATSISSSYAVTASSIVGAGFNNMSTSLNANTSSVTYLNVMINGIPQKIALYGV